MTQIKNMPHSVGAYLKGVGVESVELDANNHLIVHLDNGETVDAGEFKVDGTLDPTSSRPLSSKALNVLLSAVNRRIDDVNTYIDTLVGGNATEAIDNLNEIIAFLQNFKDSETLASTLVEINNAIAKELQNKVDKEDGKGLSANDYTNEEMAQVERVRNGSVVTDNTVSSIAPGEAKPASADAIAKELQKKVDKVEGKGLSTNDYTNEDKAQVAEIEGKQDTLTLTVKDNGNIVIGNIAGQTKEFMPATPSGDPMHYAYIDAGATWSSSTRYWSLNGLKDITNDQMRKIYNFGFLKSVKEYAMSPLMAKIRTNLLRIGGDNIAGTFDANMTGFASNNNVIEVINLKNSMGTYEPAINASSLNDAFRGCSALQEIYGRIICLSSTSLTDAFVKCLVLRRVRLSGIRTSISFSDSPLLDKESLVYIIQNAKPTSAITITLHAEAYARLANDADILAALTAQPNITLISA